MNNRVTLKQAEKLLPAILNAKVVPFLHSSPALGKSSLARQLASKAKLKVIDLRLTEMDSSDLNGLPYFKDDKSTFLPFDTFPLENSPIPDGYNGWLLLLDELNSALPSVQAAAYKLILDRMVGQHRLHDDVYIIACGNMDTDSAVTFPMSSALISRFAHFYIEPSATEWREWAIHNDIDSRITSYIGFRPAHLYTFKPELSTPYASPRTWEMLSKVIKDIKDDQELTYPLLSSCVGESAAEFIQFIKLFDKLPSIDDIVKNPTTIDIPHELGIRWALISLASENITTDNYTALEQFLRRFTSELQVVALKEILARKPNLFSKTVQWRADLSHELFSE